MGIYEKTWKKKKGKIIKNGGKKKIKPTKIWKRKNNEKKIKIRNETNKYSLENKQIFTKRKNI
jgi:hypothetical protein